MEKNVMGKKFYSGWTPPKFEDGGIENPPEVELNTTCPKGKSMVSQDEAAALAALGMDDILPEENQIPLSHR